MRRLILISSLVCLATSCTSTPSDTEDDSDVVTTDGSVDLSFLDRATDSTTEDGAIDATTEDAAVDSATGCTLPEPAVHRSEASTCDSERRSDGPSISPEEREYADCLAHDECTEGTNGRCIGNSHDGYYCTYDNCFSDGDCADGVCECGGGWRSDHNVCLPSSCLIDSDCGDGGWCSPSFGTCGEYSGTVGYFCHTCEDECTNDTDCSSTGEGWGEPYCMFNPVVGRWVCSDSQCAG